MPYRGKKSVPSKGMARKGLDLNRKADREMRKARREGLGKKRKLQSSLRKPSTTTPQTSKGVPFSQEAMSAAGPATKKGTKRPLPAEFDDDNVEVQQAGGRAKRHTSRTPAFGQQGGEPYVPFKSSFGRQRGVGQPVTKMFSGWFPRYDSGGKPNVPDYVLFDDYIGAHLCCLSDEITSFAEKYFSFPLPASLKAPGALLEFLAAKRYMPELARIVGYIGVGGPNGSAGWEELIGDRKWRVWLVEGVLGFVLGEHVLGDEYFGQDGQARERGLEGQYGRREQDGFARAPDIAGLTSPANNPHALPPNFLTSISHLTAQLYQLLLPLLSLLHPTVKYPPPNLNRSPPSTAWPLLQSLHKILSSAAVLSIQMRRDPDVVYHLQPAFKDNAQNETWKIGGGIEVGTAAAGPIYRPVNAEFMRETDPVVAYRKGETRDVQERVMAQRPLVRVVGLPAVVAYRRGGFPEGFDGRDSSKKGKGGKTVKGQEGPKGVRTRVVFNGRVALRWGTKRRVGNGWDDEDGDVGVLFEGQAPKEAAGFVELRDALKAALDKMERDAS